MKLLNFKIGDEDFLELKAEADERSVSVSDLLRERVGALPITLRQWVYSRDDGICQICRKPVDPSDYHIDHIIPRAYDGSDSPENLQLAHPACNYAKGSIKRPRKSNGTRAKTELLSLRMGSGLKAELEQAAYDQEMRLGEFIRWALAEYLRKERNGEPD